MSSDRTSKSLAQRVDIRFHERPNRLRRFRWRLSLAAAAVALLWLGAAEFAGARKMYQAGPVSAAHQVFANDCQKCHVAAWTPWARLITFDPAKTSTPDEACIKCHAGPPHHAHAPEIGLKSQRCADCHREHRGHESLAKVSDRACTHCHADLRTASRTSSDFVPHISDFASHPEFALLRPAEGADLPGPGHRAHGVAEPAGGRWRDKSSILLNHARHLDPKGVLAGDGKRRVLDCESCHKVDVRSGEMRPIRFQDHCADCHRGQLSFDSELFADVTAWHGDALLARGEIRQRYATYIAKQSGDKADPDVDRGMPGLPPSLSQQDSDWVNRRMQNAERVLFLQKGAGCRYCHTDVSQDAQGWRVAPPNIPDRWLTHSQFRHDRHRLMACVACHDQASESTKTRDVLLPGIADCKKCHAHQSASAGAGVARADCVECHVYHDRDHERFNGSLSLELESLKEKP